MRWEPGYKVPGGGRPKGSLNKLPCLATELKNLNFDPLAELIKTLPDLKSDKKADVLVKLLEFVFVRRQEAQAANISPENLAALVREYLDNLDDKTPREGTV